MKKSNGISYVTYKWLLSIIIGSGAGILAIVGGLANATFYTKPAGAAIEQKVESLVQQISELKAISTETRQDIKVLLARKK